MDNLILENRQELIDLWEKQGRPLIHLGPGENCFDLELLLSHEKILSRHIEAINNWRNNIEG
jgi:hypothetical protein